jgi:hypothetical protein
MIEHVFKFEGQSYDPQTPGLFYEHSLSLHNKLDDAEKELEFEKNMLLSDGYSIKSYNKVEINGEIKIECILNDEMFTHRILTVEKWLVR